MTEIDVVRFYDKFIPEPNTGCWLWIAATDSSGYGRIWWGTRVDGANRVSWRIHRGEIPRGMFVCHRCDVKSCVNPDHLFLGTNSDNIRDYIAKGGKIDPRSQGERNGRAKLAAAEVATILERLSGGSTQAALAREYGLSEGHVSRIARGVAWRAA